MAKNSKLQQLNYTFEAAEADKFLREFKDPSIGVDEHHDKYKYRIELQAIKNGQSRRLDILIEDLETYFNDEEFSVQKIIRNAQSYRRLFYTAADRVLSTLVANLSMEDQTEDLINFQREINIECLESNQQNPN